VDEEGERGVGEDVGEEDVGEEGRGEEKGAVEEEEERVKRLAEKRLVRVKNPTQLFQAETLVPQYRKKRMNKFKKIGLLDIVISF